MKQEIRDIGIEAQVPKDSCNDKHCPFHGHLPVRGRQLLGKLIRSNAQKTVVIQLARLSFIPKYERYEKRITRIKAHLPPCIKVNVGDDIKMIECRPISKTKSFVVIGVQK